MFVPLTHDGVKGWIFNLVCPGNALSVTNERLLLLKNATVNRNLGFDDVCKEKHVFIAYNDETLVFEVNSTTGEMKKYIGWVIRRLRYHGSVAWEWEIQSAFFKTNNIKPQWINANGNWGTLNNTSGQWSGAVGMIQRDEADYAIRGFSGTYERSKVTSFSPGLRYLPNHWLTRYPKKLSPTWNLLRLFTKAKRNKISILII